MMRSYLILAFVSVALACSDNNDAANMDAQPGTDDPSQTTEKTDIAEDERYENPIDRKTYVSEGGWITYEPQGVVSPQDSDRIKLGDIRLLSTEDEFAARTPVDALAAFIELVEASARDTLRSVDSEAVVLVQFSCVPNQHTVQLAHHGNVTQDELQSYYDALVALEALTVSSGEVSFQATIHIGK